MDPTVKINWDSQRILRLKRYFPNLSYTIISDMYFYHKCDFDIIVDELENI
jgi:hypothetical protein